MTEKISEWLETAIKFAERRRKNVTGFRVVIETERSKTNEVIQRLRKNNIKIIGNIENFIVADIPDTSYLDLIARDPYVKYVSYEKKFWPMAHGLDELIKRIAISTDSLLKLLSTPDLQKLGFNFKPAAELTSPFNALLKDIENLSEIAKNPSKLSSYIKYTFGPIPVIARADWKLVTYTRELLGVPKSNRLSSKTIVGVIDSELYPHPAWRKPYKYILLNEPLPMGHGCLTGDTKVVTTYCGLTTLEELWRSIDEKPTATLDGGEFKAIRDNVYVLTDEGPTRVIGIYRMRDNKSVRIHTYYGTIESTTWHKFFVIVPKKRWKFGYEIKEIEAEELYHLVKKSRTRLLLLLPKFDSTVLNKNIEGIDWRTAYLAGLIKGDGSARLKKYRGKSKSYISITSKYYEFIKRVAKLLEGFSVKYRIIQRTSGYGVKEWRLVAYKRDLVRKINWINRNIRLLGKNFELLCAWISGFFDADGGVDTYGPKLHNTDIRILETIQNILRNLGIYCYIRKKTKTKKTRKDYWTLQIEDPLYERLLKYSVHPRKNKLRLVRTDFNYLYSRSIRKLENYRGVVIKDVELVQYDKPIYFYDLSTEAGKYTANGIVTHNTWCSTCAFGDPMITRFGHFYPVAQAAPGRMVFVKVFGAFGPCSGYQVMKAMEICAKNGCKVVSMSLGGTLTEPVDKDPECKLLDSLNKKYGTIFVVAAGNEDGKFEIGSPGAALRALTVAALDWKDKYKTSSYSSRGFQGKWYLNHKDVFEEHLEKYGDVFVKPDCGGIGGDRNSQIVSGVTPWYDGIYDFVPDGWDMMIGCVVGDTIVEAEDIVALYKYRNDITYELVTEKHHLIGNWRHLVLTDKGWKMLKDITTDDKVFTKDGIEKIVCCKEYGKEPVYDMTTRSHIYIANGIISHNTSMATPHVAGMVALLVDRGVVKTVDEIKNILRTTSMKVYTSMLGTGVTHQWNYGTHRQIWLENKSDEQGWGVFHWKRFSSV